jgi:hypothetical protein
MIGSAKNSVRFVIRLFVAFLVLVVIGIAIGGQLTPGPYRHAATVFDQMLTWDGLWYADIAEHGYKWSPSGADVIGHHQNLAFFPIYPLFDNVMLRLWGSPSPALMILPGLIFGLWSIFAFHNLSISLLPQKSAHFATTLFALWPASCFLVMGYPVGLINLCVISALADFMAGKMFRAALWCGIGTATAPGVVFVSAGLCLERAYQWFRDGMPRRRAGELISFGLISVSGIIGFSIYLFIRFHDGFLFLSAQKGYLQAPPFFSHVATVIDPLWYGLVLKFAWQQLILWLWHDKARDPFGRSEIGMAGQLLLNLIGIILAMAALFRFQRLIGIRIFIISGWFVLIGYLWFVGSMDHNVIASLRLLYPVIALFLGLAAGKDQSARFRSVLTIVFGALTVLEVALVYAGYVVI